MLVSKKYMTLTPNINMKSTITSNKIFKVDDNFNTPVTLKSSGPLKVLALYGHIRLDIALFLVKQSYNSFGSRVASIVIIIFLAYLSNQVHYGASFLLFLLISILYCSYSFTCIGLIILAGLYATSNIARFQLENNVRRSDSI